MDTETQQAITMVINQEIEKIKNIIIQTVPVEKIYLFGSYVYGTPNADSDYDFYVVVPDSGDRPATLTENIYNVLYKNTNGKPVDILVKRLSDFERRKILPTIEREVVSKGVVLYGDA